MYDLGLIANVSIYCIWTAVTYDAGGPGDFGGSVDTQPLILSSVIGGSSCGPGVVRSGYSCALPMLSLLFHCVEKVDDVIDADDEGGLNDIAAEAALVRFDNDLTASSGLRGRGLLRLIPELELQASSLVPSNPKCA